MIKQLARYSMRKLQIEKKLYGVWGDHNKMNDTQESNGKILKHVSLLDS